MSWNRNNRAHTCLCFFEKWHHDRRDTQFNPTGEWTTDFLIKSAAGDTSDMRSNKARAHAELLDGVFASMFRAKYEDGFDQNMAIAQMNDVLSDSSKKMKDLGDPIDAAYQFIGEL